jgi:murein DD-endopeptidase MepM/ murein hydrolase activator NlpD
MLKNFLPIKKWKYLLNVLKKVFYTFIFLFCTCRLTYPQASSHFNDNRSSFYTRETKGSSDEHSYLPLENEAANFGGNPGESRKKFSDLIPPELPKPPVFRSVIATLPEFFWTSDSIRMDCVWINNFEYYEIWNTNKINPYNFDGLAIKDTLDLPLFSSDNIVNTSSLLDSTVITSDFGLRKAQWHYGTDLRVKVGQPVYAPFDGIVRISQFEKHGYGRFLVIRHQNGLETLYGHLSKTFVAPGDNVKTGDVIAAGGNSGRSTAPHLHFEVRYKGNAIDPNELYDFSANSLKSPTLTVSPQTFAYLSEARAIRLITIRRGDTLSGLSVRYGVPVGRLCYLNGISRKSILRSGHKLRIN